MDRLYRWRNNAANGRELWKEKTWRLGKTSSIEWGISHHYFKRQELFPLWHQTLCEQKVVSSVCFGPMDWVYCCYIFMYRCCHHIDIFIYPMLRDESRFWLVNNREIWSRISRLTSSAWDIKTKERHWWRHNDDSDRRPLSLPLRYDLVRLFIRWLRPD